MAPSSMTPASHPILSWTWWFTHVDRRHDGGHTNRRQFRTPLHRMVEVAVGVAVGVVVVVVVAMASTEEKKALRMYSYLIVCILLSSGQIFFNKVCYAQFVLSPIYYLYVLVLTEILWNLHWVLLDSKSNRPYPVGLTLLHMIFSTVLCSLVDRVFEAACLLFLWSIP
uniref:Uncharacterized protein n=1 Tax=Physcomitrium patens TaxID=3218 RepID=A0A2K1KVP1_PHYPA|nr:hypothetical protein PHYPA_004856 [Physcomitrium patens]